MSKSLKYIIIHNTINNLSTLVFKVDKLLLLGEVELYFSENKLNIQSYNKLYTIEIINNNMIKLLYKINKIVFIDLNDQEFFQLNNINFHLF